MVRVVDSSDHCPCFHALRQATTTSSMLTARRRIYGAACAQTRTGNTAIELLFPSRIPFLQMYVDCHGDMVESADVACICIRRARSATFSWPSAGTTCAPTIST